MENNGVSLTNLTSNMMRWIPFMVSLILVFSIFMMWPSGDQFGPTYLNWVNIFLLFALAVASFVYGVVKFNSNAQHHVGSKLRSKMVAAMVIMVLVPSLILQITANQVIEKGFDVWFDVRVDTLLDKAMNLAQGFYADVASDMELSLEQLANDNEFSGDIFSVPLGNMMVSQRLTELLNQYGWHRLDLFDASERVIAGSQRDFQGKNLSDLKAAPVSDIGKLSMVLGRHAVDHEVRQDGEYVVGYLPIYAQRRLVGLLRAEVKLPDDVIASARSIETDYRTYKELERHRQGIQDIFMNTLMIVMIVIVFIAAVLALLFVRRLTSPVEDLAMALKQVEAGDFDAEVAVDSEDEFGSLAISFNSMTSRLKYNMDTLTQTQGDLTDALVNSRQRQYVLENLLANLESGVILLDYAGDVRLMNESCLKLLMIQDVEKKHSIYDFSEAHLKGILEFFETLKTQELENLQYELVLSYKLKDTKLLVRGTLLGHEADVFAGWLLVFDDITQLAEVQKHQAWSEVAQRLAHEIKNPLTPIKLSTERVKRRFRDQVDNVQVFDTCTDAVINQVERLQRLLADFSNLATLPKPKLEVLSIAKLLGDLRELYSPYPTVTFEGMPEGEIYCDPDQIRQCIINLIDNALATKTHVRVYVEVDEEGISFYVQDEGLGMDERVRKHMFEPYFSTKEEGSGLGLAIAQRISEEHNGHLQLVSEGSPTRFCMWLPHVRIQHSEEDGV